MRRNSECCIRGTNAANLNTVLKMISVNNQLFLVIAAFIITTLVVYFIRRSSVNNAWIIAIIVGGVVDCVYNFGWSTYFEHRIFNN